MRVTKKEIKEAIDTKKTEEIMHCLHVESDESNYTKIRKAMTKLDDELQANVADMYNQRDYINMIYNEVN